VSRVARGQVLTRGTPPRLEGCRSASRGLTLTLMTCAQSTNVPPAPETRVSRCGQWPARGRPVEQRAWGTVSVRQTRPAPADLRHEHHPAGQCRVASIAKVGEVLTMARARRFTCSTPRLRVRHMHRRLRPQVAAATPHRRPAPRRVPASTPSSSDRRRARTAHEASRTLGGALPLGCGRPRRGQGPRGRPERRRLVCRHPTGQRAGRSSRTWPTKSFRSVIRVASARSTGGRR